MNYMYVWYKGKKPCKENSELKAVSVVQRCKRPADARWV